MTDARRNVSNERFRWEQAPARWQFSRADSAHCDPCSPSAAHGFDERPLPLAGKVARCSDTDACKERAVQLRMGRKAR